MKTHSQLDQDVRELQRLVTNLRLDFNAHLNRDHNQNNAALTRRVWNGSSTTFAYPDALHTR